MTPNIVQLARAVSFGVLLGLATGVGAAEEVAAERIDLKDGSTLYLHPDGTSRMIDAHGKRMAMQDGVEMETADGQRIVMMNKRVWVEYGPPGKGSRIQKVD